MFDDFEKSVKAIMYDRLASPLVGSFITAWCIVNYKFFLIIFSGLTYAKKNLLLSSYFSSNRFISFWSNILEQWHPNLKFDYSWVCELTNTVLLPALGTVFYIFIYPRISKKVFRIWQQYIKEKREIKQKIEKEELLTLEESEKIREEFLRKRVELNALLSDKDNEIKELKDQYAILEEKYNSIREKTSAEKLKESTEKLKEKDDELADIEAETDAIIGTYSKDLSKDLSDQTKKILLGIVNANDSNIRVYRTDQGNRLQVGNSLIYLDEMYKTYLRQLISHNFIKPLGDNRYMLKQEGVDYIKSQQNLG